MITKNIKKLPVVLLLGIMTLMLSGCVGEVIISQHLQEQERAEEKARLNKELKAQGLPPMEEPKPADDTTPQAAAEPEINPIALLYEDRPEGKPEEIFALNTLMAVFNGGTSPTVTFKQNYYLTEILTYHWNDSKGSPAGTIALKDGKGTMYGPWQATLVSGVYWTAQPSVTIPAGTYTVIDSDPSTWSQNSETGGNGIANAHGIPMK